MRLTNSKWGNNAVIYIAILGLTSITIGTGLMVASPFSFADVTVTGDGVAPFDVSAQANALINVASVCTMTFTGGGEYSVTLMGGTSAEIPGSMLRASCNDPDGYAIYAIGYSNNEHGNTKMISSDGNFFNTGLQDNASNWSMKLTATGTDNVATIDNNYNNYQVVADNFVKVAHYNGLALGDPNTGGGGSTLQSGYRAYVSTTQNAGSYVGKVKYVLVHPPTETPLQPVTTDANYISYNPNASGVVDTMADQNIPTNATQTTLRASNFQRSGYGFAGWNDEYDMSGTNYGPNETITFTVGQYSTANGGLSLYANWVKSAGIMQDWAGCSSLSSGSVTALTDSRDGNTYAVAKLADDNCWMIENLRLDNAPELSTLNTNNPSLPLTNIYSVTQPITSNHLSSTTNPFESDWCASYRSSCIDKSMLATNNTIFASTAVNGMADDNIDVYSYGNYYNWYSATTGNGTYNKSSGDTDGDICPAGWHLPTNGRNGPAEFNALDIAMGGIGYNQNTTEASRRWRKWPNNFVFSGYVNGGSVSDRGLFGYYWSSSTNSRDGAYSASFSYNYADPTYGNDKYDGLTVRCITQ